MSDKMDEHLKAAGLDDDGYRPIAVTDAEVAEACAFLNSLQTSERSHKERQGLLAVGNVLARCYAQLTRLRT